MTDGIDLRNVDTASGLDGLESGESWGVHSGADVVSIERIADLLAEFGRSFAERVFTPAERRYCDEQANPPQHYAARWAAKESFLKVLDEPSPAIPTAEIGVVREPAGTHLSLGPRASDALTTCLRTAGIDPERADWSVCLSHDVTSGYALAHVVVVGPTDDALPPERDAPTSNREEDS